MNYSIGSKAMSFNNIYYAANATDLATAIGKCATSGDAIVITSMIMNFSSSLSSKNISFIGQKNYKTGFDGATSFSYAGSSTFYQMYMHNSSTGAWGEMFCYSTPIFYNVIYKDDAGNSFVYWDGVKFYNSVILGCTPYNKTYYYNCAFKTSPTANYAVSTCVNNTLYDSNYLLSNASNTTYGVYSGTYSWSTNKFLIQNGNVITTTNDGLTTNNVGVVPCTVDMFTNYSMTSLTNMNSTVINLLQSQKYKILMYKK